MTDSKQDADRIWDEYKYRHQHTWNTVFKLTLAVLAISALPYTQETVVCVVGGPIVILPIVAVLLSIFGSVVIFRELRVLDRVRNLHRCIQGTTDLGADRFRLLVISYLVTLSIAAVLNCQFVTRWQETLANTRSGSQCFEPRKSG
jgi:hypothetical protein